MPVLLAFVAEEHLLTQAAGKYDSGMNPKTDFIASRCIADLRRWIRGLHFALGFGACLLGALVASQAAAESSSAGEMSTSLEAMARINSCWSPSFSPDGSRIAFVSDLSGVPQVWIVDAAGGWPQRVTALDDQVGGVRWSPTGEVLAFSMAPGGGMNQQIFLIRPDGSGLRRVTDGGQDNNWAGDFHRGGKVLSLASNRDGPASMDVFLYDLKQGELRHLADNPGIGFLTDLSDDGGRAVLYRMESRSDDNLFMLDVASGEEHLLTDHEPPGSFGGGHFSRDGASIYLSSNLNRDRVAFARVELGDDGTPGPLQVLAAREDAELDGFQLTDDGRLAALQWNASGRNEVELFDLEKVMSRGVLDLPHEIAGGLTFSADGSKLAMTLSGATAPSDVWVYAIKSGTLRQVTHSPHPGVDLSALVQPELVTYEAHDGLELSGWLYRPKGVDLSNPAPYVLSFHGGPEGQSRPSFSSTFQALSARGIGVFSPNVRGSSGFGKRFVNLDNGALRFDGIRDIDSTVQFLVGAGIADPERLGIMGGSYGGYMTMAGLAWYPDLFAAGANLFGVVNFETFFEQTEEWMAAISKVEYGDPDTQAQMLYDLSPIHRLDQVDDPTLVLHGANDTNVPVVEAEQVVDRLKERGVPVEYVLFPDEGHGFRKTPNRIRSTVEIVEWFSRYLARLP